MAKQIVNEMATNLSLDTKSATAALKELTSVVKNSSAEARILENQYKASGEAVNASKAKYEGLEHTMDAQKAKIDALKSGLENVNTDTAKGRDLQTYLNNELAKAERQYASYSGQIEKAKHAYELQESGIQSLNKEIQRNVKETDAQVDRLEAEGKASEANKVKHEGLSNTIEKQSKLYKAQKEELDRMEKSGDKSADSISKQRIALNRTGKELAENQTSMKSLNSEMRRTSPNPFVRLSGKVRDLTGNIKNTNKQAKKTHSIFKQVFSANVMANVAGAAWRNMTMHIGDAVRSGNDYLEQQDKMSAQWKTLAGNTKDAKVMTDGINDLATAAQNSAEMVNGLASQFYAVDKNKDEVLELSKSTLTLQDAFGATDDAVQNFGKQWSQMMANGKVSAQDFMSFTNVFPALKPALLDYEKDVTHNSSLTMKQLNDMISQGKMSSETMNKVLEDTAEKNKKATKNFGATIPGMTRTITATMPKLIGEIEKPFYKMKNPLVGSISTWVTDKNTTTEFNKLGKALTKTLTDITSAFGGKKLDAGKVLDGVINGLTHSIKDLGKWTKTHKKDIKEFLGNFKEKTADTIKILGSAMSAFVTVTAPLIKLMAAHPKVAGTFLAGFMIANKLSGPIATMGAMGGATKKMLNSFRDDDGVARKGLSKLGSMVKTTGRGIKKSLKWTASLATRGFKKGVTALKTMTKATGRGIAKSLKWTASVATKGAKMALNGLVKTAKATGRGIKLAFNFLKANPLILLVSAITAVAVAFVGLYKHNKKFHKFVNGLVSSAKSFFKGITKWFKKAYNKMLNFFKGVLKFVKKDWKEILLFIVNPISGAFALVYKHNNKFRKAINKFVNTVVRFFRDMGKNIIKTFKNMVNRVTGFYKGLFKSITSVTKSISKGFKNSWNGIKNFFNDTWDGMKKIGHNAIWSIKNTFDNVLGKIGKAFSNTWKSIKSGFSDMWQGMKQLAGDGINAVIKIPNKGISGINGLIHDFGGPKHAIGKIPKVAFANGTGAIDKLTHAVLNDGSDSPETGNKETIIHPNGKMEVVQGMNTERLLLPGTEVLNAKETAMMMGLQGIKHFAGGTGFWSRVWGGVTNVAGNAWDGLKNGVKKFTSMLKFITNAVAHPVKTLNGKLNLNTKSLDAVYKDFGTGFFKKTTNQAKKWWTTLWSMASEASNAGADGGMKGDDYKYKNRGKDSMPPDEWGYYIRECVSFVANRLANLGVPASKFSHLGNGRDWVNAKVPHSKKPKVGDVAVYAAGSEFGNHVSMVTGVQGGKISGEEYNWNGDGRYHKYHGRNASGATTFLDFGLGGSSKAPEVKANSPMAKLIKRQTGGMMKWIQKFISPLNDTASGKDNDVQSWHDAVKKALNKLGLSTSSAMISKVLRQIQTESGGNAKARQPGADPDGDGSGPALGLMQTKRGTFNANALKGHHNIFNGYDNILAGLNYARKRYGNNLSFLGNGHGYANGGLITRHQLAEIGENNQPEMIIPLSSMKSSRGFELIGQTAVAMAARDGQNNTTVTTDNSKLEGKLDNMITLLSQLVAGQGNQVVQAIVDKNELYRKQATDMNMRDYQSLI